MNFPKDVGGENSVTRSLQNQLADEIKKIRGYAFGTSYIPQAGSYLVGERGPEMVNIPQGASVTPNDKLGGNFVIEKGALEGLIIFDDYGVDRLFDRMSELWKRRGTRPVWR